MVNNKKQEFKLEDMIIVLFLVSAMSVIFYPVYQKEKDKNKNTKTEKVEKNKKIHRTHKLHLRHSLH